MDDEDVIVIYDEIDEEPEQFTAQNYEYMLAQALLTREAIQEKLLDPDENSNFQFIGSASHNNSMWDNFLAITYGGVEQNFFKCRDCTEIFDKDPQKSLGQMRNHNCRSHFDEDTTTEEIRRPNRAKTTSPKKTEKIHNLTREELDKLYQNPKERKFLVAKQKSNFKCFAWQFLDVVFYKGEKQQFARCRHCGALVTYTNRNGTTSIRKHALRCPEILRVKRNLGKQGSKSMNTQNLAVTDESKCETSSNDGSVLESSLVPQVEIYSDEGENEYKVNAKANKDIITCAQLKKLYIANKDSKSFLFKKSKAKEQKNSVWNWFDAVYYKDIKQECFRCTICNAFVSGVDKNELTVHINNHNAKNTSGKKPLASKKEKISETVTETKPKSHMKKQQIPLITKTEPLEDTVVNEVEDTVAGATNQVTANLVDFVISSAGQSLNLIEDQCFRTFVQGLISLGAKHGERNANDFLPTVDSILKQSIPVRVRALKSEIKETIADEPHLNISVDLIKDTTPRSNGVSYFTVKVHVITKCFMSRVFVLGAREFREKITDETVKEEFLNIMKEYTDTHELHSRCILVLNERNETLVKAFADYTRLPSVTHCLESIVNKVLLVEDPELNISCTVIKIQQLFDHITGEHSYSMSKGECLLDLLEEFYEMNKPIEKLLKYTRPCSVNHSALSDVSKHTVKTILNGFQVIKLCVDTIRQNQVTLNGILLWKKKLVEQYSPVLYEHRLNARLKFHTLEQIQSTFIVDDPLYKIALFLNPNFKNLKFLSENDRQEVFNGIKELFVSRFYDCTNNAERNDETEEIDKEINKYYITKNLDCSNEDLLEFWKKITIFPRLKMIARHILSIPGTSDGVSEEVFQKANRSLANGIGTSIDFSSITFLHSNSSEDYTSMHT